MCAKVRIPAGSYSAKIGKEAENFFDKLTDIMNEEHPIAYIVKLSLKAIIAGQPSNSTPIVIED